MCRNVGTPRECFEECGSNENASKKCTRMQRFLPHKFFQNKILKPTNHQRCPLRQFNQNVDVDKLFFGPESNVDNLLSKPFGMFYPAVSIIDALSCGHQLLQATRLKTARPSQLLVSMRQATPWSYRIFI